MERSTCRLRKQGVDYESNERIIMIANASSARAARCKGASVVGGRRVLRAVAALPPKASAETAPIEEVTGRRARDEQLPELKCIYTTQTYPY